MAKRAKTRDGSWPWCKVCESYHHPKLETCPARKKKYYTVGARFLYGQNPGKVYTYRVARGKKVHLGQELIADTDNGTAVVVVVRIDATPQDTGGFDYKSLTKKVAPL